MPRVIITDAARTGIARCRSFLAPKNSEAARRAAITIGKQFALLQTSPEIGRPSVNNSELRELLIPFGDSGYTALYIHDYAADEVFILAFRHQKEAGY
jgi:plasmid stabilization system protein ParE